METTKEFVYRSTEQIFWCSTELIPNSLGAITGNIMKNKNFKDVNKLCAESLSQ